MRASKPLRCLATIAVAAFAIAVSAGAGNVALAKSKGKTGRVVPPPVVSASIAPAALTTPRFFTINQVLSQQNADWLARGRVRLASLDPIGLRGSFSPLPAPPRPDVRSDEPFGLSAFRAPEGLLWTKWRTVEAQIQRDTEVLAECRVELDRCPPEARRFLEIIEAARAREGLDRLEEINRLINLAIRYTSDLAQHGSPDVWSAPLATMRSGRGDCEDYAIAKYAALRQAGVPDSDLRILLGNDSSVREAHAVLAVLHEGTWQVLDNRRADHSRGQRVSSFAAPLRDRSPRGQAVRDALCDAPGARRNCAGVPQHHKALRVLTLCKLKRALGRPQARGAALLRRLVAGELD